MLLQPARGAEGLGGGHSSVPFDIGWIPGKLSGFDLCIRA